jgi:uncharacterized membrane protein YciS (DUF1049 family)
MSINFSALATCLKARIKEIVISDLMEIFKDYLICISSIVPIGAVGVALVVNPWAISDSYSELITVIGWVFFGLAHTAVVVFILQLCVKVESTAKSRPLKRLTWMTAVIVGSPFLTASMIVIHA